MPCGGLAAYPVNTRAAAFLYIIPVIVGFLSFLPGGVGLSEQSAVGVLLLSDATVAVAVAATLVMRIAIVALGFLYGLLAGFVAETHLKQPSFAETRQE